MTSASDEARVAALPKAELHVHLEGSVAPATAVELAARRGLHLTEADVAARYRYADFHGFLEAYKWVTSLLEAPADYALVAARLAEALAHERVLYAEVTISAGVMLRRGQDLEQNLRAIAEAPRGEGGPRMQWILDATRQFGPDAARDVARQAGQLRAAGVVAFGLGGDELALPAGRFRAAFDEAARAGLHRVVHAGEIGGPGEVRDAIEQLGAERIGHGIGAAHDPRLLRTLAERGIALEVCPSSNVCTGALARQLGQATARVDQHPLRALVAEGVAVVLGSDDPPMFHTSLGREYALALRLGLSAPELARIAARSFEKAFLGEEERAAHVAACREQGRQLGLDEPPAGRGSEKGAG